MFYYRPKRSFGQGNVFTGVCLSRGGGSPCLPGGVLHGCQGGSPWLPGGFSTEGGLLVRTPPRAWRPPWQAWRTPPPAGRENPPSRHGDPPTRETPPARENPPGIQSMICSTHPTGMHSCCIIIFGLFTLLDLDSDPCTDLDTCTMQKFHIGSDADSDSDAFPFVYVSLIKLHK